MGQDVAEIGKSEESPNKIKTDVLNQKNTQDTVSLPLEENRFIHVTTNQELLSRSFGDYAVQFGIDRDKAEKFITNNVDFEFGSLDSLSYPGVGKIDMIIDRVIGKLKGGKALGVVVPNGERLTLRLDIQKIAESLPDMKTRSFQVGDYKNMNSEARITAFEQTMKSLTEHEFFHVIQYLKNPGEFKRSIRQVIDSTKLFLTYMAGSTVAITAQPERGPLAVAAAAPIILGSILRMNKGMAVIENDAYAAQRKALQLDLPNPYSFDYEEG